jgi:hypothetical protein
MGFLRRRGPAAQTTFRSPAGFKLEREFLGAGPKFHAPTGLPCGRFLKKTTSRAAMAPAAKLGESQMMFFMDFFLGVGARPPARCRGLA